ncbi:unnamed protein product [Ostreobium quekettii]|uniref:L-serine ammonia-lyase n=1 Tax=Ostreobium quekettii TaxID=121088 RepID=A0A8S1J783_9CHLO|nr:unnamed protein product [Ostreobium quekettii]|eukprot:evm.model.scf_1079EXC.2 EVM.evm.TU.scf_1079EXC.2   scf_1079EXC:3305-4489(+)
MSLHAHQVHRHGCQRHNSTSPPSGGARRSPGREPTQGAAVRHSARQRPQFAAPRVRACHTPGANSPPLYRETPLLLSDPLSRVVGRPVYLKMENMQPSGSFKSRGLGHFCEKARSRGCDHLVISSGGNAGQAVAHSGRVLGIRVTVVVPSTTPAFMIRRIEDEGADVVVHGDVWDEADALARELAGRHGREHVPPFDHPDIWEGHASMIDEIKHQLTGSPEGNGVPSTPGAVVASVGGGGLLVGCCVGMQRAGWNDVPIVAVETEGAASFAAAVKSGRVVSVPEISSVAKSLGARRVSEECLVWRRRREILPFVMSDAQAVEACFRFAVDHRALVEPACGASLGAAYFRGDDLPGGGEEPVVVVVCGGNMATPNLLRQWAVQTRAVQHDVLGVE